MSKYLKFVVATLAAVAMATPAFAVTADFTGFFQARGFMTDTLNGVDAGDTSAKAVDQRFRLFTNAALNENVKAVFGIEIDNIWGDGAGAVGTDAKGQIEVKHLYLDFNIPEFNTNVKAGEQYFKHGGGLIIGEDAAGLQARWTPAKGQSVLLSWVKMREGTTTTTTNVEVRDTTGTVVGTFPTTATTVDTFADGKDADYYHLQYDTEVAGWRLSPFVAYLQGNPTGNNLPAAIVGSNDFTAWYGGIEASGKAGPLALAATAIVNSWDNDLVGAAARDNTAFALWARGTYTMGNTSLIAEAARYGDDETGAFVSVRGYNNFAEIITGGQFDSRNAGFNGNAIIPNAAGNTSYYMNFLYGKLGAEQKYFDGKDKVSIYYIYAEEAEDVATSATAKRAAKTIGHEIDAYYDHQIVKGLTFTVGGAYLVADDDFGAGDNAWKAGTALTYKF